MKNFQSITRSISSKGRISILLVLFLLLLNPQRSICQTGINQSFTLEWSISNVGVTLYPCASSFSAIATYNENIPVGSVISIVAPDGFIVEGDFFTNASGSNEFNFTYSSFSGTTLTFDCFVTWPDGTVVEAEFLGPPSLSVLPSSNLVTIFEGAPNPIEFYGQSNVSFSSLNPTTFNRSVKVRILSNDITEIFVSYADEIDVSEITISAEGLLQVQSLPLEGGYRYYTFNQTVFLTECPEVANTGSLTITINCADGTSQSYTQILNAEYIIDPPDFTTSNFEFAPSSNTTVGCPGNYVLSFDLNKSNSTTINLQDIIVPYNSDLYTLVSITCDGQDLSTIQTNGYESSDSQISVICTFTLNCSYFQTCSGVQDFLMYFSQDGIQIRYKSVCAPFIEYTKTANSITIGSEQTVVLLGGPTENSFTDTNQPIVLSYQLMLGAETNYGLSADAQVCSSIKYHVVCTLNQPTAFVGAGLSVQNVTGGYYIINSSSSSVEFELTNPDFNEYMDLDLMFSLDECPYDMPPGPGFGPIGFNVTVKKICEDCETCFRVIACDNDIIQAHCIGDCDSPVGTVYGALFERITFGWTNHSNYPANPIQNRTELNNTVLSNGGDEQDFQNELHKLYPKDLLRITASGNSAALGNTYNELGFQIAYTDEAGEAFSFVSGNIIANYVIPTGTLYQGEITTDPIYLTYNLPIIPDDFEVLNDGLMGLAGPVYKLNLKNSLNIAQNYPDLLLYPATLSLIATFEATPENNLGVFETSVKGQFYLDNSINNNDVNFAGSCDAYGEYITFVVPGSSFNLIPTAASTINTNISNYQTFLPGGGINGGFPQLLQHSFTDLNFCKSSFLMGARVFGGYGQYQDDFPFEYRPIVGWPNSVTLPSFNSADEINSPIAINYNYNTTTNELKNTLYPDQLLQPIDKTSSTPFYNGIALQLNRDCSNGGPEQYQPITGFEINTNAYIHWAASSFTSINELSVNNTLDLNTIFNVSNSQAYTATNYNLPFSLTPYAAELTNFYLYFDLTDNDGNPVNGAEIGIIPALQAYHYSNAISPNLYFFPSLNSLLSAMQSYSLPLTLPCIDNNYKLKIRIGNICGSEDASDFLAGNAPSTVCNEIERNIILTKSLPSLLAANVVQNLQIINYNTSCYLQWTITVNNPSNKPAIYAPVFLFNTPNGLIYQNTSSSLALDGNNINNAFSVTPTIEFTTMPPPYQNNTLAMFVLSTPNIVLNPGSSLEYTLHFNFSTSLCGASNLNVNGLSGVFKGKGECTQTDEALPLVGFLSPFSSSGIQADLAQYNNPDVENNICCIDAPVNVTATQPCSQTAEGTLNITQNSSNDGITSITIQNSTELIETFDNPTVFPIQISVPIGTYSILVLANNGNLNLLTVVVNNGVIIPNVTPTTSTVCQNDPFTFSANDSNPNNAFINHSYVWKNSINEVVSTSQVFSGPALLSDIFSVEISTPSCSTSTSVNLNVTIPPTAAIAGDPQTICAHNTILSANEPTIGIGVWSGDGVTFTNPNSYDSPVENLSVGNNTLTWTISNGICPASVSNVIVSVQSPPTAIAGTDQTLCSSSTTLAATPATGGLWSLLTGSATFTNPSLANTLVSNLGAGANVFRWTVPGGACDDAFANVTITTIEAPTEATAGTYPAICTDEVNLVANQAAIGTGQWSSGSGLTFTNPTSPTSNVIGLAIGSNAVTWTISNGICPSSSSTANIIVEAPPVVNAGVDISVCADQIQLNANPIANGVWSVVSGNSTLTNPNSNISGVSDLDMGANTFQWSVTDPVCGVISDQVVVTQFDPPTVEITLPNEMCTAQSFELVVSPLGGSLTINGDLYSNNVQEPINVEGSNFAIGTVDVSYTVIAESGCEFTQTGSFEVVQECLCLCPNPLQVPVVVPDQVSTGDELVAIYGESMENRCIHINSNITFSNTFTFQDCNITMAPGIELAVVQGGYLKIFNSELHGCEAMWKGIRSAGKLNLASSLIRDAQYGVTLVQLDNITPYSKIVDTKFQNNFVGITNDRANGSTHILTLDGCRFSGGGLIPNYIGQQPVAHSNGGLSGIKVFGYDMTVSETNSFEKLMNGILASKSMIRVEAAKFSEIRTAYGSNIYTGLNYFYAPNFNRSAAINLQLSCIAHVSGNAWDDLAEPEFIACEFGVCGFRSYVDVSNCKLGSFDNPGQAIRRTAILVEQADQNSGFYLSANKIRSKNTGIEIRLSSGLNPYSQIKANNVTVKNPLSIGIKISNNNDGNNILVQNNTINLIANLALMQETVGMHISGANGISLTDNKIRRKEVSRGKGIRMENSEGAYVFCNHVLGWDEPGEPEHNNQMADRDNFGFYFINSPNATITNNLSEHTRVGFQFVASNLGISFKENTMNKHGNATNTGAGLLLGFNTDITTYSNEQETTPVLIGNHTDARNQWLNMNNAIGAKKNNLDGATNKFFVFNGGSGLPYDFYPSHSPEDQFDCLNDPFFVCGPGGTDPLDYVCEYNGSPLQGYRIANPENVADVLNAFLADSISFNSFNDEMLYQIKKDLDAMLFDSLLQMPDTGRIALLNQLLVESNTRELNKISGLAGKFKADSSFALNLKSLVSNIDSLQTLIANLNELLLLDTLNQESILAQISSLTEQISPLKEEIEAIKATFTEQRTIKLTESGVRNTAVVPENFIEQLEKQVNSLFKAYMVEEFAGFNVSQQNQLDSIASICPLLGGNSVFKARSLQSTYNDSIYYDDKLLCNQQGVYYRLAAKDTNVSKKEEKLILFPNPTSDKLTVFLQSEIKEDYSIEIFNLMGQQVFEKKKCSNTISISFDSFNLSAGTYIVALKQSTTGKVFRERFQLTNQ